MKKKTQNVHICTARLFKGLALRQAKQLMREVYKANLQMEM